MQVNAKAAGKAAVHCAAVSGNISMLKAIMEFNPDLEIEVYFGNFINCSSQMKRSHMYDNTVSSLSTG